MSYTARILTREVMYLNAQTGQPEQLTSEQRLLSAFTGQYIFAEVYTSHGVIKAKTLSSLGEQAFAFAESNNLGCEFEVYIYPKKTK